MALGVASIDKDLVSVSRVLKLGTWTKITKLVPPSALPLIFTGLRLSLGVDWTVLIAAGNVALAVDAFQAKMSWADKAALVVNYIAMFGLARAAEQLSGGMQQRVSLARALAIEPQVLMMDEPLSAIDVLTRANLADEIKTIRSAAKKTVVLITNDVDEALVLADRIMTLNSDGPLGAEFDVTLPRSRDRSAMNHNAGFKTLRADVTAELIDVGIRTRTGETRILPQVTLRHALPAACAAA